MGKALRLCPILSASNPVLCGVGARNAAISTSVAKTTRMTSLNKRFLRNDGAKQSPSASRRASGGGEVRVIAGLWRSRRLSFPDVPGLRPTPDRVRETLFNWLGHDLSGYRCLDLYAGSGALGFEALSRGAESVTMVERDSRAVRALEQNAALLGAGGLRIIRGDALEFLRRSSLSGDQLGRPEEDAKKMSRFDVIFLDPPFNEGIPEEVLQGLPPLLATGAQVYVETGSMPSSLAPAWRVEKRSKAGQVHFQLMRWEPA